MSAARKTTRVRGLAPWEPRGSSAAWVEAISTVLEADRAYWPLTVRYVWYRLIGQEVDGVVVEKDPSGPGRRPRSLQKVQEKLNRGRRAGLFPWEAIHDEGVTKVPAGGYSDPSQFWRLVRYQAEGYHRDWLQDQPVYVEVWCEAAGMVPRIARTTRPYGVSVFSGGGHNSTSMKHDAAKRILEEGRPTVLLHIGDLDKHGEQIYGAVFSDVPQFVDDYGGEMPRTERLAVTQEQVQRHDLPTDERGYVQAEAVPAATLAAEVRRALDGLLDARTREAVHQRSLEERQALIDTIPWLAEPEEEDG